MRKVIAATFVSLDGVMQAPGGPEEDPMGGFELGGWTATFWDEAMGRTMDASFSVPFDLLLGRRTYEIFAAHWPNMPEGDLVTDTFNACTKYVATRSDQAFGWRNTVALRGDAAAEVARLKEGDGPMLLIQGSSVLIQSLLSRGLIDEFRLMIFPVVLGRGKRLFGDGTVPAGLRLTSSSTSSTGVIMANYVPVGPVPTGSFAIDPPSEAEVARRARIARE
jgi:dihydrofolate reductase